LFSDIEYNLRNCTLIYDISVPVELRIAKPLSNFDRTLEVASFSFESKEKYLVNLYTSTCSCKDFSQQNRSQYVQGDIRRFCKHLMQEYKSNFGLSAATDFQKFIIENSQTLYTQVEYLKLDELTTPVIVNYRFKDEWWNIFIQNEKGAYKSYGYSPMDGRFSYGETPRGLTAPLRQKLEKLRSQLGGTSNSQPITKKRDNSHQKKSIQSNKAKPTEGGCATIMILPAILILYHLLS